MICLWYDTPETVPFADPVGRVPNSSVLLDTAKDARPATVSLAKLAGWAGEPQDPECLRCTGTGRAQRQCKHCDEWHTCACTKCDGEGYFELDRDPVNVGTLYLDRVLLARCLAAAGPSSSRTIEVRITHDMLRLDAPEWRVVLIGLKRAGGDRLDESVDTFAVPVPAGVAVDAGRAGEGRP